MVSRKETRELLKQFAWECYEFWANELDTDDDRKVWLQVLKDVEGTIRNPFTPKGDFLDEDVKKDFIKQLEMDLGI